MKREVGDCGSVKEQGEGKLQDKQHRRTLSTDFRDWSSLWGHPCGDTSALWGFFCNIRVFSTIGARSSPFAGATT